jgi:sugar phosphate permease
VSRAKVVAWFSVTYFFYYLARYNYPVALPFIKTEYGFSAAQVGMVATALTLGYAVGQFVNGALVDRKGPRLMMALGGVGVALANLAMGGSWLLEMFVLAWLANGYFQAMGYPSTLKLIVNWFRGDEGRGKALGVSEFAQSVASVAVLPLSGWLAAQWSWRLVFVVPALLMGLATAWYWLSARDGADGPEPVPLARDLAGRWRAALSDWRLDCAYLSYGACQFVRYSMVTWIPMYFVSQGLDIFKAALASAAFQVGGALGSLLVGWLADLGPFRSRRWLLIVAGMSLSGLAGAAVGLVPGWAAVAVLFACGVGVEALEVAYFLTPADFLGREMTATGVGVMNATGKLVASLQGVALGGIIDALGYGAAFGTAGLFGLLAAALVLPLGRRKG